MAHAASHHSRRLPHPVVGQLSRVGGLAAGGTRAPDDRVPILREAARRRDPGDGGREAQGGGAERVHRSDAVLVRVEGRARDPSVGRLVSELLGSVPRCGRRLDACRRHPPHGLLAGRVSVPLPRDLQGRVKLEVLTIGTELLLGYTVDTNAAELGRALAAAGVEITRHTTVADRPEAIRAGVAEALDRAGFVITTGGLGPTRDDMTKTVVAELFGKRLVLDERLLASIQARFDRMGRPMPDINRTQAEVPEGAVILPNARGTAPGLWVEDAGGRVVVLLPGVPREMRGLLVEEVLPRIVARQGGARRVVLSRTVRTTGVSESALAERVGPIEPDIAPLTLAYLPSVEGVDLRVTAWGLELTDAESRLAAVVARLEAAVGEHAYGEDDADLAAVLLEALRKGRHRLAVAESCTGGMVGERVTNIPGASDTFIGGVVAYADVIKTAALKVPLETLEAYGAVSEETVRAMAEGAQRLFSADCTIAVTGIAGPGGGTPEKPVGTVWLAARVHTTTRALKRVLPGDRDDVRRRAAQAGLDLLRRLLAET
ncbi:MAG: competence/damage-inducible protein A [Gemmatimonadetes bacterium]|nr:MAG: competence/damage-inducible protein A [Gemmatimonadota bacterium]